MIDYIKKDAGKKFIVATEAGILHAIKKEAGGKIIIPAPVREDNTCACSECAYMKKNTLEKLYSCMLHGHPEIEIDEALRIKALDPIHRMLEISKN